MATSSLHLPKFQVAVDILLRGKASPEKAIVFVSGQHDRDFRQQRVIDLLESPEPFLTVHEVSLNAFALYHKMSIIWVSMPIKDGMVPLEESAEMPEESLLFDTRKRVKIEMMERGFVEGYMLYSAPSSRSRVSDFLNRPERYLCLWTESDLLFLNKWFILRLQDLTEKNA